MALYRTPIEEAVINPRIGIRRIMPVSILYSTLPGKEGRAELMTFLSTTVGVKESMIRRKGTPEEFFRLYRRPLECALRDRDILLGSKEHYEEIVKVKS